MTRTNWRIDDFALARPQAFGFPAHGREAAKAQFLNRPCRKLVRREASDREDAARPRARTKASADGVAGEGSSRPNG